MKFSLFGQKIVLDDMQSETLKVALSDAWKQCEFERSLLDDSDKRLPAQMAKLERLEQLEQTLFGE